MKELFLSVYGKYTHFIAIDWNNLFQSFLKNVLIILISIVAIIILSYFIGILDDINNPFFYVIGKILSVPIAIAGIMFALIMIISIIIASIVFVIGLMLFLFNIFLWLFPIN